MSGPDQKITDALPDKRLANLRKGGGRPKGVPNKTTIAVKQALIDAFDKMGGVDRLVEFAQEEPGEFYKLWVKILPQEHTGANGEPLPNVVVSLVAPK